MKRKTKIWIGVVVLALVGVVTVAMMKSRNKNVTSVTTEKVKRTDLVSKVTASGNIEAKRKVDLSANIMGQIVNLAVREGDIVKKGDFLMQIDQAQHASAAQGAAASVRALLHDRDSAQASAEEAELAYQRAKKSYSDQVIPLADLEQARAAAESARQNVEAIQNRIMQARASLAGAQDTLQKTTIRAPISGIVTRLPVEEGEVAVIGTMNNPGTVLMTVSDMSVVEAVMEVDETDIPNVKVGQTAKVTIDAYPNETWEGVVTEVASSPRVLPSATDGTQAINFEVKINVKNPPAQVRPGFSASAEIITATKKNALAVPIQALVVREKRDGGKAEDKVVRAEEEGLYIYQSSDQTVKFTPVETGITGETQIEVTGVKDGAEIVTGPFKALREIEDGAKVKVEGGGKPKKG